MPFYVVWFKKVTDNYTNNSGHLACLWHHKQMVFWWNWEMDQRNWGTCSRSSKNSNRKQMPLGLQKGGQWAIGRGICFEAWYGFFWGQSPLWFQCHRIPHGTKPCCPQEKWHQSCLGSRQSVESAGALLSNNSQSNHYLRSGTTSPAHISQESSQVLPGF